MITRLQISGFKNLNEVDLYFGPFTCIAGANGSGKSNLFDAIRFLSALASDKNTLMQAAATVRDNRRAADVRSLFHRVGETRKDRMRFGVEMIVQGTASDDLGQKADASITFLRYELELGLRTDPDTEGPSLEILHEALLPIKQSDVASKSDPKLPFPHSASKWRSSVIQGARRRSLFISTTEVELEKPEKNHPVVQRVIQRHQDGGNSGKPAPAIAQLLKRTILSSASAETPTALCARREMESWLQLQLEPTALRQPSDFNATPNLLPNGENLPATLDRIARSSGDPEAIYAQIANRLSELIKDVRSVTVERDKKLELLTLILTDRDHTSHPARALSDGTLRFLALSVLELDPAAHGVLCLEEPENGIHPDRIAKMLHLLRDIAMDVNCPVGPDNPLRQVIINTHSPLVVGECPDDALVLARGVQAIAEGRSFEKITFGGISQTWRERYSYSPVSRGQLLAYLEPSCLRVGSATAPLSTAHRRIRDRADLMPEQSTFNFSP